MKHHTAHLIIQFVSLIVFQVSAKARDVASTQTPYGHHKHYHRHTQEESMIQTAQPLTFSLFKCH